MINRLFLFLIISFTVKTASAQLNSYDSILVNSDWRTFRVHLPKGYTPTHTYSLILGLHGGGGSALQFGLSSELANKSDSAGFIVVFPEGKKNPGAVGARTWNAGYCCANNAAAGTNDVGFISQLIDTLLARYPVDTNRVYATGHSNGGMMCYRLAVELSDRVAAVAISSATMVRNYPFFPKRPVPIIHFHSYKDQNVPYYGGEITGVVPPVHSPPVDSIIQLWSNFDECKIVNDTVHKGNTYNEIIFKNGKCQSQINVYITFDGGHAWPGGNPGGGTDSDTPSTAFSANYLLWKFFQQYHLNCPSTNGMQEIGKNEALTIFPNPLNDAQALLSIRLPVGAYELNVYDAALRRIKQMINCRNEMVIDCSDLMKGFYLIEVTSSEGKIWRNKVVKQ